MEQLDTLIFDVIVKLRKNKKQSNENSIYNLILKEYANITGIIQIIKQKDIRGNIIDTYKKDKIINRPCGGKSSYYTVSYENTDSISINNGLLTIESVTEIFKEMSEEQRKGLVNIISQNATPLHTPIKMSRMINLKIHN